MFSRAIASILLSAFVVSAVACEEPSLPSSVELTNATNSEVMRACVALRRVGFDYWSLSQIDIGGRLLEVAAAIHTDHPGPQTTQEYCTNPRR